MTGRLARTRTWLRRLLDEANRTVSPYESEDTTTHCTESDKGE